MEDSPPLLQPRGKPSARALWLALALVLAATLLLSLFVDWRAALEALRQSDWRYLATASAALVAGLAIYAVRWRTLLRSRPGLSATFHAANVGHATNSLVPGR